MTSFWTTTAGSIIQTFSTCGPGASTTCFVEVRFTLSEVVRSHWRFMVMSSAPVAFVMLTTWGSASSNEIAYLSPSPVSTLLRGERYAQTVTGPAVNSVVRYSSRGPDPGARLAAVTGNGVIPAPVRPRSGIRRHDTGPGPTLALQCSASIGPYPPASTNPRRHDGGRTGLRTTASTTTSR